MNFMATRQNIIPQVSGCLAEMKEGRPYRVEIKEARRERTLNQNSLFHAIIDEIAKETGMSPERIKDGVKEQYGVKERVELSHSVSVIPKPSRRCDTAEMGKLIDGALYEAAEQGIDVRIYHDENETIKAHQKA